jgi:hypothetical protein
MNPREHASFVSSSVHGTVALFLVDDSTKSHIR